VSLPEPLSSALEGRYRIERELGRGGMAVVYLAEDLKHRRKVAVKILAPDVADSIGLERFLREIGIAARLTHPHILPLHDSGAADGHLYYVTPFIEGESLRAHLEREKRLPLEEALRLAREIASALGHAHHHGLVHRDIKPENILLAEGIALVADFGIARALGEGDSADGSGDAATRAATRAVTTAGAVLGTPRYMSPEQAAGGGVDARADLYALACVLYEMLAGEPPFVAPTAEATLRMHLGVEPRPVTDLRPSVPGSIGAVIARGLAKLPADRYATAARFAEALLAAEGAPASPAAPAGAAGAAAAVPNNLPPQRTRFIGRERELAEGARLLAETRLLTLTGIGGCGKTRLAIQLGGSVLDRHPDGVWFVDLAPLSEGQRVPEAVAASLGVREEAGKDLAGLLKRHVRGRRALLVLDSCEHLLTPCAEIADALLGAGEELRLLATSREALGVGGERLFALPSLDVPSADAARDPHAVESSESVRLFVDRARNVAGEFALTAGNATAVAEICRRLDGIPLAIELAAARAKILSVDQILARLEDRFRLLTGGSRTALPRHQTLRATIQWSYDQLSPDEQRLFRTLSVFAGGWSLESAARVVGEGADEFEVLDLLARLVDKSLVTVERDPGGDPRYGFLETVRQYGLDCLQRAGEAAAARERHLGEFLSLAERAYPERYRREERWGAVLEREHDNLRAALQVAQVSDPERHLELAGALAWFWQARSHFLEGCRHLSEALAASAPEPARPSRARGLWGAGTTLTWQGDTAAALPRMESALAMWRALGDRGEIALALEGIGWVQLLGGNDETSRATFEECLRLQRDGGDPALINRARVALGQVLVALHEVDRARALAREIIDYAERAGDRRSEHFGWHYLGDCALIEGRCEESLGIYRRSLALAKVIGDRLETSFEIQGVAMSLSGLGEAAQALRLAAAARAEWARLAADIHMRFWDDLQERYIGRARADLGGEAADRAWEEGWRIPFEDAVAIALGEAAAG